MAETRTRTSTGPYLRLGRETKYRTHFGAIVVNSAKQGYSLSAAAAECGVSREKLLEWATVYPDLRDAIDRAKAIRSRLWEGRLLAASEAKSVTGGQAQILLFMARVHNQVEFNNNTGSEAKALLGDLLDAVVQLRAERAAKPQQPAIEGPKVIEGEAIKGDTAS